MLADVRAWDGKDSEMDCRFPTYVLCFASLVLDATSSYHIHLRSYQTHLRSYQTDLRSYQTHLRSYQLQIRAYQIHLCSYHL
jgi:hypothetical protein